MFLSWWALSIPVVELIQALKIQEGFQARDVVIYESKVLILNGTAYLFQNKTITCLMYFQTRFGYLSYHLAMKPQASLESLQASGVVIYESKVLILNGTAYLFHNKMITCLMYFQTRFGYLSYHLAMKPQASLESLQASGVVIYESKVLILNGTAYLFHNKMITCLMYFQTRFGYLSYRIGLKQASCITML